MSWEALSLAANATALREASPRTVKACHFGERGERSLS